MLQDAGVKTAEARNGREAVEKFAASEEGAFDAILMDVMMPVMDGMQAARAIRALPRQDAADVPIIAMTANAFAEDQSRARDCGMTKYLTKPVDPAILKSKAIKPPAIGGGLFGVRILLFPFLVCFFRSHFV